MGYAYTELPSGNRDANLAQARAYYEAASRIYTEESHPIEWAVLQERISILEWLQGRKDEARLLLERALEIFQNHGDLERIEHAQNTLQLWEPTPTSPVHRPKPQVAIFLALMIPVAFALWGAIQFLLGRLHG
jgi:tetratricopeptide (TPR) repeat protein